MTENEALKLVESMQIAKECEMVRTYDLKATLIKALEDIQAYRAIGTVEGYERAIKSSIENYNLYREYKAKVERFEAIGTVEEFKALKEKSDPKKPIKHGLRENKVMCPHCTNWLEAHSSKVFCCYCGRKLDWN